jgi:hypothetical protein
MIENNEQLENAVKWLVKLRRARSELSLEQPDVDGSVLTDYMDALVEMEKQIVLEICHCMNRALRDMGVAPP